MDVGWEGDGGEDTTTTSVDISFWNLGGNPEQRGRVEELVSLLMVQDREWGWWYRVGAEAEGGEGPGHRCGRLSHIHSLQVSCSRLLEEKRASS